MYIECQYKNSWAPDVIREKCIIKVQNDKIH